MVKVWDGLVGIYPANFRTHPTRRCITKNAHLAFTFLPSFRWVGELWCTPSPNLCRLPPGNWSYNCVNFFVFWISLSAPSGALYIMICYYRSEQVGSFHSTSVSQQSFRNATPVSMLSSVTNSLSRTPLKNQAIHAANTNHETVMTYHCPKINFIGCRETVQPGAMENNSICHLDFDRNLMKVEDQTAGQWRILVQWRLCLDKWPLRVRCSMFWATLRMPTLFLRLESVKPKNA